MRWYYANNNQRQGPVGEFEFARLVREGVIKSDTLVWRQGMPDWQTYAEAAPVLPQQQQQAPTATPAEAEAGVEAEGELQARAAEILAAQQPPPLKYAGFWVRAGAKIIDHFIVSLVVAVMAAALGIGQTADMPQTLGEFIRVLQDQEALTRLMSELIAVNRLMFLVNLLYTCVFLAWKEATPGKMILGLKVVRGDGSRIGILRIVARFFAEALNQTLFCIGYLTVLFDEQKRTMHDFICDTRVIHTRG